MQIVDIHYLCLKTCGSFAIVLRLNFFMLCSQLCGVQQGRTLPNLAFCSFQLIWRISHVCRFLLGFHNVSTGEMPVFIASELAVFPPQLGFRWSLLFQLLQNDSVSVIRKIPQLLPFARILFVSSS